MRCSRRFAATVLAVTLSLSGCGTSPTEPTASGWGGVWTGTLSDSVNGIGTLRVVLDDHRIDDTQSFWTGTWAATYTSRGDTASGLLAGGVNGAIAMFSLSPASPRSCTPPVTFPSAVGAYQLTNVTATSAGMRGAYLLSTCTGSIDGQLELHR